MASLPQTYKAAAWQKANISLDTIRVELKMPRANEVLVKVLAVGMLIYSLNYSRLVADRFGGVCHSDSMVQDGSMGNSFPIIPGLEMIGDVVAIGDGEHRWKIGDRVGGGWHGGKF
jgi:D-arabinose 1-dehydrogenase-like Zn-dependent alcohol dehydrogenase